MKTITVKKPKQKRSWEKFHAILATCPRVLSEFGYAKSTAAKLALEADVSIGTFYDYFSCKEAAFIAYLDYQLDEALALVAHNARREDMPMETIMRALVGTGIDFAYEQRDMIKLVVTRFSADLHLINLEQSYQRLLAIAQEFADKSPATRSPKDPQLVLYTVTNLVLGFQLRIVTKPDEQFDRDEQVTELVDAILRYLYA